jgi:hypothetical protein
VQPTAKEKSMFIESSSPTSRGKYESWLDRYKREHEELLQNNSEFARWLEEEYVPLAGGWQY